MVLGLLVDQNNDIMRAMSVKSLTKTKGYSIEEARKIIAGHVELSVASLQKRLRAEWRTSKTRKSVYA